MGTISETSFATQKRNRWRLQGKSVYEIFGEIVGEAAYPFVYGILSESIHGSWNESLDYCLSRNTDGTFSAYALFMGVDVRAILPLVRYAATPYALWLDRIQVHDGSLVDTLDWIQHYSYAIYARFDELYDGPRP